jgi:hypothetical protein
MLGISELGVLELAEEAIDGAIDTGLDINQNLIISEGYLTRFVFNFDFNDTLTFTQAITNQQIQNHDLDDTLTFTETFEDPSALKPETTFSDEITFSETISINLTANYSFTDSLLIREAYKIPGIKTLVLPNTTVVPNQYIPSSMALSNIRYLAGPTAIRPVQWTQLSCNSSVVNLPGPEWNDEEGLIDSLMVKRSILGAAYPYRKRTLSRILSLSYTLTRPKVLELKSFLREHMSEVITFITDGGEQWVVVLMNNPIEISSEREYKNQVQLEFEGIKL